MQEIEVKILDIDVSTLTKKLSKAGAKLAGKYNITSVVFDTPKKELLAKKELLRLRRKSGETTKENYLTYKANVTVGKSKTCEETEIKVSDFDSTAKILQNLGLIASKPAKKKRISYKIKNSLVEIDIYAKIPPFFEIESPNEAELEEIVALLGYTMKDTKAWNAWEVFAHYKKKLEG